MRRARPAVVSLAAAFLSAGFAADAAGAPPASDVRLNGKVVDASAPLTLRAGDRLATGLAAAVVRSAGGGHLRVEPSSALTHTGTERGVESFFAVRGTVEGDVGPSTILGAAAGWATTPDGAAGRVRVTVAPAGARESDARSKDAATFRAIEGNVWLRFHAVATWLPPRCEATLVPSADGPGSMACATGPDNRERVEFTRASGDRTHAASLPAGASVVLTDRAGGTRFACRAAPAGAVVRIEARSGSRVTRSAALGAGAAAVLSRAAGVAGDAADTVTIEIPALPGSVLTSLIALDREFATLGAR